MVSMIPFGLLAGVVGGREVRITEIDESGFCFRTIEENISDSEALKVCFYDIKNGCYRELEIPEYDIQRSDVVDAELSGFCVKYKVTVKQKAYAEAVQRLLYQYNHYIHLKLEEDDSALAKSLTGYPGELDEVKCGSLEEQVGIWRRELTPEVLESAYNGKRIDLTDNCSQCGTGFKPGYKCQVPPESGVTELALEIDRPELYQEYLDSSLTEFSKKYAGKCIGICGSIILEHRVPDHLYIGNQFCHLLFPERKLLFEIIEKELQKENIEFLKLTGQTKVSERINLVDEFNSNPNKKLFLISLKAGGTGLNLVGADVVIHYDPWWNLSAENQATDRTYRIGQKRNVQVYKLITKNSIEEKIYELQKRKETLIDSMLSTNQTFISKLSKEDIMNLFE